MLGDGTGQQFGLIVTPPQLTAPVQWNRNKTVCRAQVLVADNRCCQNRTEELVQMRLTAKLEIQRQLAQLAGVLANPNNPRYMRTSIATQIAVLVDECVWTGAASAKTAVSAPDRMLKLLPTPPAQDLDMGANSLSAHRAPRRE